MGSSRSKQPPWNFQCPYKDSCPHLEGLSTHWVFKEYQTSYDENLDHWRLRDDLQEQLENALAYIKKLEKDNEELKAKVNTLHRRQFKSNKKSKNNTSENEDDRTGRAKEKKRGAPYGHPGWCRKKPDHIDKTVIVPPPEVCPHCGCDDLTPIEGLKDHLQEDIVFQPCAHVTNFRHHQAFCPQCNRAFVKASKGELLHSHIGPITKAAAVYLRYGLRIPYRKVQELFNVFFNMSFVPASAVAFDRTATRKGIPIYEDLKEKLRASAALHADETYWREDGVGHYVWYAGNDDLAFFHINRHRSSEVAQSILGNSFDGILTTDGYAAYNAVNPKDRQTCLAHLIRKSKEVKQELVLRKPRFQDKQSIRFCDNVSALLSKACEIGNKFIVGTIPMDRSEAFTLRLHSAIHTIGMSTLSDKKAETLRSRLIDPNKEYHRLFTFLKYPDVQPTNNQAEQSLRNMVIFRKICFGTRSPHGSYSHSVLPSLLLTAKRQGKHPLEFFKTLFTSDTATAQDVLYNDSS
jgi:transposase